MTQTLVAFETQRLLSLRIQGAEIQALILMPSRDQGRRPAQGLCPFLPLAESVAIEMR
jgi:hypothetical protein